MVIETEQVYTGQMRLSLRELESLAKILGLGSISASLSAEFITAFKSKLGNEYISGAEEAGEYLIDKIKTAYLKISECISIMHKNVDTSCGDYCKLEMEKISTTFNLDHEELVFLNALVGYGWKNFSEAFNIQDDFGEGLFKYIRVKTHFTE